LIFESDKIDIQGNSLVNNDVGIAASSWGWFFASASNCKVTRNVISDALVGMNLRSTAWDQDGGAAYLTNHDPVVRNNKIVNNVIENTDADSDPIGAVGIAVESNDQNEADAYAPIVENNKLIRNSITGFDEQVSNEGTDTKVRAIEP
jgi:hypothetical protein